MVWNAGDSDDTNWNCQGVEEQQVDPGLAPEDKEDWVATVLQQVIDDEVKSQVSNAMTALPGIVEEAVEQLLPATALSD